MKGCKQVLKNTVTVQQAIGICYLSLFLVAQTGHADSLVQLDRIETAKSVQPLAVRKDFPAGYYQGFGLIQLGTYAVPYQPGFYSDLQIDSGFSCQGTRFCDHYAVSFLQNHVELSISNDPLWEIEIDKVPEHHVPRFNFAVEAADLKFTKHLHFVPGRLQIFRSHRNLAETINVQVVIGALRVGFRELESDNVRGGCFFDTLGPGFKYVAYSTREVVPFSGMMVVGVKQGCHYELGNSRIAAALGYSIKIDTSVGQSGNGTAQTAGSFGSLLLEPRVELHAGLRIGVPQTWVRVGIQSFQINAYFNAAYHMNRICLSDFDINSVVCSSNTSRIELQAGILFGIELGLSKLFSASKRLMPLVSPFSFGL